MAARATAIMEKLKCILKVIGMIERSKECGFGKGECGNE
jgi:hypothetical protein